MWKEVSWPDFRYYSIIVGRLYNCGTNRELADTCGAVVITYNSVFQFIRF